MDEGRPFRTTLNANVITGLDMCESMDEGGPFRSTLNTKDITDLDMCKAWTGAVPSVAL